MSGVKPTLLYYLTGAILSVSLKVPSVTFETLDHISTHRADFN